MSKTRESLREMAARREAEKRAYRGPCTDRMHGYGHHWCSEMGGYTGGLKRRKA